MKTRYINPKKYLELAYHIEKYCIKKESGCWMFPEKGIPSYKIKHVFGTVNRKGYPYITHNGRSVLARRLIYTFKFGEIPKRRKKRFIKCTCSTIGCFSPEHIVLTSMSEVVKKARNKINV